MKKSGLSESEVKLIVILLAMLMLGCAYLFGYNMCLKKAKEIEASNDSLRQENTRLQQMVDRKSDIENETELLRARIGEIIEKYPVNVPTEKAIYLLQNMEEDTGIHYSTIGFSMNNLVSGGGEGNAAGLAGYYADLTLSYVSVYEDLKTAVDYVKDFDDRMNIPMISAVYDETTGNLTGVLSIRMYYLTGTDKEYQVIPNLGIESGVENIFGTKIVSKEEPQRAEESEDQGEQGEQEETQEQETTE